MKHQLGSDILVRAQAGQIAFKASDDRHEPVGRLGHENLPTFFFEAKRCPLPEHGLMEIRQVFENCDFPPELQEKTKA